MMKNEKQKHKNGSQRARVYVGIIIELINIYYGHCSIQKKNECEFHSIRLDNLYLAPKQVNGGRYGLYSPDKS